MDHLTYKHKNNIQVRFFFVKSSSFICRVNNYRINFRPEDSLGTTLRLRNSRTFVVGFLLFL